MFITNAYAQAAGGSSGEMSSLMTFLPFILIFVIMYFLIIRPNRNREKQRQEMLNAIRRGDTVITDGGVFGRVTKVIDKDEVEVEIADNVRVRVLRAKILNIQAKGQPVAESTAKSTQKSKNSKKTSKKTTEKLEKAVEKSTENSDQKLPEQAEKKPDTPASEEKTEA